MEIQTTMFITWGILVLFALFLELNTDSQVGWAAIIAAIIASIINVFDLWIGVQTITFVLVWASCWIALFFCFKWMRRNWTDHNDGYNEYIDKTFSAYQGNEKIYGLIKINDKVFRFKSKDEIHKGEKVRVNKIIGVTMHVIKERGK